MSLKGGHFCCTFFVAFFFNEDRPHWRACNLKSGRGACVQAEKREKRMGGEVEDGLEMRARSNDATSMFGGFP